MGSEGHQPHVFFFPLMAQGHTIPMIDIATLFSLRGLKSTIITTTLFASNIISRITRLKNSGLDIGIETISFPSEEAGLPKGCESVDALPSPDMTIKFFDAIVLLQPQVEQLLEETHPDCLVSDMFITWSTDVAHKHGIPRLVFHGTSFFSQCVLDSLHRYSPQISDLETFVVPGLPDQIQMKKSQMSSNFMSSNERFQKVFVQMTESEVRSDGVVVNSFYELEAAYAEHFRNVMGRRAWHIGPVSLTNNTTTDKVERGKKASIDEYYCLNWLNSKGNSSVIYVSFGSISRFSCVQLTEIAKGLEASGVSFIWVVRTLKKEEEERFLPEGFEERMDGKGLIIRDWAPQMLILDHPAVGGFMTHCGWNSVLEGVSAGVPMITWPLFAEQFQNEVLITQVLKIGINVGVAKWNHWIEQTSVSVTEETVEKVVSELMKSEVGEEMRKRAEGLREKAKRAVEEGGSSYSDLTALIENLHQHMRP